MKTYRIYVRDVFVGEGKGLNQDQAFRNFLDHQGMDSAEQFAKECFADPEDIDLRLKGAVLW